MSLRPVGINDLGRDELCRGLDKGGLLLRRKRQEIGPGQCPRRLDAHGPERIAEQRCGRIKNQAWRRSARQSARRCRRMSGSGSWIAALIAGSETGEA